MTGQALVVTGAGGHLGRRVVEILLEKGAAPVVAVSRDPTRLADLAARGAEVRAGDFDKPETLRIAFAGAGRVLIISTGTIGGPVGRIVQHKAALDAAVGAGARHVLYTSSPAPVPMPHVSAVDDHFWTEAAIAASAVSGWTILRNNIYAEIILLGLANALKSGQLFTATGTGGRNYVTREDCAAAAAAALASDFAGKRVLEVTGPAPVTQAEIAEMAAILTGKPVTHAALPAAGLRQGLLAAGLTEAYADTLVDFDVAAAEGFHAIATPVVRELTGRDPTSVREFLTANKAKLAAM